MASNGSRNRGKRGADEVLAAALAAGKTVEQAAAAAGMSRRTATRRLANPDFRERIKLARGVMVERAMGSMTDSMTEAADVLRKLLKAKGESIRLGACRAMLEYGVKLRESVELEARLAALEAKAAKGES